MKITTGKREEADSISTATYDEYCETYEDKNYITSSYSYSDIMETVNQTADNLNSLYEALIAPDSKMTLSLFPDHKLKVHFMDKNIEKVIEEPLWSENKDFACDAITGIEVKPEQVVGETVIIPYEEDGHKIVFCGQFNEQYHWNDNCIINVYKNDVLVNITEAKYSDGNLLSYKQAFVDSGTWYTSEREVVNEVNGLPVNSGETWKYKYEYDILLNFDFVKATSHNVITVDRLRLIEEYDLIEYYRGNTWSGRYEDESGSALLVKFSEDGTVKTLYQGCFSDGKFDDLSGNAWEIAKEETTNKYYYYEGIFLDGVRPNHLRNQKPIDQAQIDVIIEDNGIDLNLEWYN